MSKFCKKDKMKFYKQKDNILKFLILKTKKNQGDNSLLVAKLLYNSQCPSVRLSVRLSVINELGET